MACPVHGGDNPTAFSVSRDGRLFHCFACGAGGEVFELVMRLHSVDFKTAVGLVARVGGVDVKNLPRFDTVEVERTRQRRREQAQQEADRLAASFGACEAYRAADQDAHFCERLWSHDRDEIDIVTQHVVDDLAAAYRRRDAAEMELECE